MNDSLAKLRARIHVLEKDQQEGHPRVHGKRLFKLQILYRDLVSSLSPSEDAWCRRVLFGEEKPICQASSPNAFRDAIFGRRSVRKWDGEITDGEFLFMVEASRYALSGCNRQPCEVLLTRDLEKIRAISSIKKQSFIQNTPTCMLMLVDMDCYRKVKSPDMKIYFSYMDAGAAIQNLLLTGHHLGLGLCWVNIEPEDEPKLRELFHIPEQYKVMAIIPVGRPAGDSLPPGRKNLEGMVHYENWGSHSSSYSE